MVEDLRFQLVRRVRPSAPSLLDADGAVRSALAALRPAVDALTPGSKVAITCGSRGIDRLPEVIRATCAVVKEHGWVPLIVPAMGSHAGATALGQQELLAEFGVTEGQMGAPVISSMETVHLGQTPEGVDVYMDRVAWEAGHVLLVNRVKMHTDFEGTIESGLMKMLVVGLGKVEGASSFHRHGLRLGYETAMLSMGRILLNTGRIIGGIGLVENDRHSLSRIAAAPAEQVERTERELLVYSRQLHGRLPFTQLDLLIVDEIGKNISGAGMDTKVIGRPVHLDRELTKPPINIRRIYVRDLTEESGGNGNGMGLADVIHERVARKVDLRVTYTNARTALAYRVARMPMYFPSDRAALGFLLNNLGSPAPSTVRAAWIRNTLALGEFLASTAAVAELHNQPEFGISGDTVSLEFDADGELLRREPIARDGP